SDLNVVPEKLKVIKAKYPAAELSEKWKDLLKSDVDIIVIATPVESHYKFSKEALLAGKHVWVEKPFTSTSAQAEELIEIAERKNLKIFRSEERRLGKEY